MLIGVIAILVAGFIGGQSPLLLKFALREMPPLLITFLRFIIACVVTLPFFLRQKDRPKLKDLKKVSLYSIFFAGNVAIFGIAIQYTSALASQILYTSSPIIIGLLSYYILKEKITRQKIIGLIVALIGLSTIFYQSVRTADVLSFGTPFGNLLTLCAVISWSLYFVFSKKLTSTHSPITASFVSYLVTTVILILLIPIEQTVRPFHITSLTIVGVSSILVMGVVSSALMFFLLQIAIQKTSAFLASLFQYLGPVSAAITAIPFLGEKLTFPLAIGGILIIVGVFYATTYSLLKGKVYSVLK